MNDDLRFALREMRYELEHNRLEVVLSPAPEPAFSGHMVRNVSSTNPEWYQELCRRYKSNRTGRKGKYKKHGDTKIKRHYIIELLERLEKGAAVESRYKDDLLYIASNIADRLNEEFESRAC